MSRFDLNQLIDTGEIVEREPSLEDFLFDPTTFPKPTDEPPLNFLQPVGSRAPLASIQTGKEFLKSLGRSLFMPTARTLGGVAAGAALTEHSLDAVANQTPAPSATKLFAATARQTKRASTFASRWLEDWTTDTLGTDPNYYDIEQESYNQTTLEMMHDPRFWVTQVPEMAGQFATPFGIAMGVRGILMRAMPQGLNAAQKAAYVQNAEMVATRAGFAASITEAAGGAYNERLDYLTQKHGIPQATAERIAASSAFVEGAAIGLIGYAPFAKVARQLMGRAGGSAIAAIALEGGSEVTQEAASILNEAMTYRLATGDTRYTPTIETMTNGDSVGRMILAGVVGTGTPAVMIGGRKLYDYTTGKAMEASAKRNFENMPMATLRHIEQNTEGPAQQIAVEVLAERTAMVETDSTPRETPERVDTMEQFLESEIMADIENRRESVSDMAFMALAYAEQSGITLDAAATAVVTGTSPVTADALNLESSDVRYHAEQLAEAKDDGQLFRAYHRMKRMEDHWRAFTPEQAAFRVGIDRLNLTDYNANEGLSPGARTQIEVTRARQAVARLATDIADVRQRVREARAAKDTDADSLSALELRLAYLLEQERGLGNVRDAMLTLVETVIGERTPIESDAPRRPGRKIAELLNAQDTQRVLRLLRGNHIKTAKRMQTALARLETIVRDAYSREQRVQAARLAKKIGRPSKDAPRLPQWNELRGFARAIAALNSRKTATPFDGDGLIAAVRDYFGDADPMTADYADALIRQVELAIETDNQIDPDTHADAVALLKSLEKISSNEAKGIRNAELENKERITREVRSFIQGEYGVVEGSPAKEQQLKVQRWISSVFGRTAIMFPRTMAEYMLGPEGVSMYDRLNTGQVLRLGVMQKVRQKIVDYGKEIEYDFASEEAAMSGHVTAPNVWQRKFGIGRKPRLVRIEGTNLDITVQEMMSLWALHVTNEKIASLGIKLERNNATLEFTPELFDKVLALKNDFKKEALLVEKALEILQSDVRPLFDAFMIETFGFTNSRDNYFATKRTKVYNSDGQLVDASDIDADTLGMVSISENGSRLMNMGLARDRRPNDSAFVVGEFWRVFEDHVWKVASMRHIARELGRLKTAVDKNADIIDAALGKRFRDYWTKLVEEMDRDGANGRISTLPMDSIALSIVRSSQAGLLSMKPAVALYQPISLMTAIAYKPELLRGMGVTSDIKPGDIIRGMPDLIDRERAGGTALYNANTQVGGSKSASIIGRSDMTDIALVSVSIPDKIAIRYGIVQTVTGYIETTMPRASREQKIAAIREMTRDIVNRTQPTYDVLNTSGRTFQHRGSPTIKAVLGMFRSQLDKNADLMLDLWIKARREGTQEAYSRALIQTAQVVVVQSFMVALIRNLVRGGMILMVGGAFNEDEFLNRVMKQGTTGIFSVMPVISDAAGILYEELTGDFSQSEVLQSPPIRVINRAIRDILGLVTDEPSAMATIEAARSSAEVLGLPGAGLFSDIVNAVKAKEREKKTVNTLP